MSETEDRTPVECRPHERRWRNYCVDKSLKDEWLERLNDLEAFDLISICEGHGSNAETEHARLPHFNLRLKSPIAERLDDIWSNVRKDVGSAIDRCFNNRFTAANFEFRSGFVKEPGEIHPQDIALLKLTSYVHILDFDASYYNAAWFEDNVAAAEEFDRELTSLLSRAGLTPE